MYNAVSQSVSAVIMILMPLCPDMLPGACVTLAAQSVCLQPGEGGAGLFCLLYYLCVTVSFSFWSPKGCGRPSVCGKTEHPHPAQERWTAAH